MSVEVGVMMQTFSTSFVRVYIQFLYDQTKCKSKLYKISILHLELKHMKTYSHNIHNTVLVFEGGLPITEQLSKLCLLQVGL